MLAVVLNSIFMSIALLLIGGFAVNAFGLSDSLYPMVILLTGIIIYAGYFLPETERVAREEAEENKKKQRRV